VEDGSDWIVASQGARLGTRSVCGSEGSVGALGQEESVMGVGKKAKHGAKTIKGKTKKSGGKVKHKGKKAKNAAKH
jgi:hypothetical protein